MRDHWIIYMVHIVVIWHNLEDDIHGDGDGVQMDQIQEVEVILVDILDVLVVEDN